MAVSHQRDQQPHNCSVHKAECLESPNLVLKTCKFPGELLALSPQWKPGNTGSGISDINEGSEQQDELPHQQEGNLSRQEGRSVKLKVGLPSTMLFFYLGCHSTVPSAMTEAVKVVLQVMVST